MTSIVSGRVGKPFGLNGEVYVHADPDLGEVFATDTVHETGNGRSLTVAASRYHGERLIVRFREVSGRSQAENLRGTVLTCNAQQVALDDGAMWVEELINRPVVNSSGETIGTVAAVRDGHAHDYLVVALAADDAGSVLVPFVDGLVDSSTDSLVIADVEGLLNLDDAW